MNSQSPVPSEKESGDQNQSILQEILEQGEEHFLSLVNSPMFYEYVGIARQLNEDELRSLYGMMVTSLRHAKMNFEEQYGARVDMLTCDLEEHKNQPLAAALAPLPIAPNTDH